MTYLHKVSSLRAGSSASESYLIEPMKLSSKVSLVSCGNRHLLIPRTFAIWLLSEFINRHADRFPRG